MARLILKRDNAAGKIGWLVAEDAKHFFLAIQDKAWPKPVHKAFAVGTDDFYKVCAALKQ